MTEPDHDAMREMCRELFQAHETDQDQTRSLLSVHPEHDTNPTQEPR